MKRKIYIAMPRKGNGRTNATNDVTYRWKCEQEEQRKRDSHRGNDYYLMRVIKFESDV